MNDTKTVTLQVSGMLRATSKNVTEAHLSRQPGVIAVDANPVSQTATVTYDPATFTATLRPTLPLKANWKHNVNLTSAITSAAGVPIAATNSYFYSLDTQPPTFSNIAASQISRTGATIVWTSNEISSSQVRYGLAVPYSAASAINAALRPRHPADWRRNNIISSSAHVKREIVMLALPIQFALE